MKDWKDDIDKKYGITSSVDPDYRFLKAERIGTLIADIESLLKKERIDEKCLQAIKSSQNILAKWIVPDSGISDNDCLTELLGILDDKGLVKYISELEGGSE